jgi:hypothetical protein
MMSFAFDRRPSSEVAIWLVAFTANDRLRVTVSLLATFRPSWTARLALFVQAALTGVPLTR